MSKQDRKYLQDSYQNGQWLVRASDPTRRQYLQVAREIFRQQSAFLSDGIQGLKPMVMRDVADALDMHESTVSRVVANKLIQTPRGFLKCAIFSPIQSVAQMVVRLYQQRVRERIRHLIETELKQAAKNSFQMKRFLKS